MEELKPCPFCGGEAELIDGPFHSWQVECGTCYAKTNHSNDSAAEVVTAWNTRPSPWISVTPETMPDYEKQVLLINVHFSTPDVKVGKLTDNVSLPLGNRWDGWFLGYDNVTPAISAYTHWMPIPELPSQ